LIQIETPDRVGLLYDLLTALEHEGVNIGLSRISTQKGAAIDTFYINDATTRGKITDSNRIAGLQRRLRAVILSGAVR
jgi:[protein-PII] uridylyltransferase